MVVAQLVVVDAVQVPAGAEERSTELGKVPRSVAEILGAVSVGNREFVKERKRSRPAGFLSGHLNKAE